MCGIAGVIGREEEIVSAEEVRRMTQTIVHRGPDEEDAYVTRNIGLGMRRLSIIDLSGGQQRETVKKAVLTTAINPERVVSIPHFSTHYIEFQSVAAPLHVEEFCRKHDRIFFLYVCFRKEYMLDLLA